MQEPYFVYITEDASNRDIFEHLLMRRLGYSQIDIFEDSQEFLSKLATLRRVPDVLFVDIDAQPYDGFAVLQMLRQDARYSRTRVIAFANDPSERAVEAIHAAGFYGLIRKPFPRQVFPELLLKLLDDEPVWYVA